MYIKNCTFLAFNTFNASLLAPKVLKHLFVHFSYRVKSFVCTDGGCTESEYSQPIKTGNNRIYLKLRCEKLSKALI